MDLQSFIPKEVLLVWVRLLEVALFRPVNWHGKIADTRLTNQMVEPPEEPEIRSSSPTSSPDSMSS
jgi:hypothetical protein